MKLMFRALSVCAALAVGAAAAVGQTVIVNQVPVTGGGIARSSQLWQDPGPNGNNLDGDAVVWQDFVLSTPATIDRIEWWGTGACELGFRIEFWKQDPGTIAYQPYGVFHYQGGNESVQPTRRITSTTHTTTAEAGVFHYTLDLASPVVLPANDSVNPRWFIAVIGLTAQPYATWNWAQGTGGSSRAFWWIRGGNFHNLYEGHAVKMRSTGAATVNIDATVSPAGAGSITGAGAYPLNSTAMLQATANVGWAFGSWTQGGSVVSTNANYSFLATSNRSLVANFLQTFAVTAVALPAYGGTVSGSGTYTAGSSVTVSATPQPGYVFSEWTEFGGTVSTTPTYTFSADMPHDLTAVFVPDPALVRFDFDNAPVHTSLPVAVTVDGLTAMLTASGSGMSIQPANSLGFTPAGFGGLCVYPNSVFASDLTVAFDQGLTYFSIMYSPQELGCDTSARMRVTAYLDATQVGTAVAFAPQPGTWPTGTLAISTATPFNRVVVHYDARPATCQDWGPIFLADNMTVIRACSPATVAQQPAPTWGCLTGVAYFDVIAAGSGTPTFQWQRETAPGSGLFVPIADGPSGNGGTYFGTDTAGLQVIGPTPADAARFRCLVANGCGSEASQPAGLVVYAACPCSPADVATDGAPDLSVGPDGFLTGTDFDAFVQAFFTSYQMPVTGQYLADVATAGTGDPWPDGFLTGEDFDLFIQLFFQGCPV